MFPYISFVIYSYTPLCSDYGFALRDCIKIHGSQPCSVGVCGGLKEKNESEQIVGRGVCAGSGTECLSVTLVQ